MFTSLLSFPGLVFSSILTDVVLFGLIYFLFGYIRRFVNALMEQRRLSSLIPSPSHSLIYGHVPVLSRDQAGLFRYVDYVKSFPAMFCFYVGPILFNISFHHPDLAKIMLTGDTQKGFFLRKILRDTLGDGLLIADGEKWRRKRHLLTPAFHFHILKTYLKVFNRTIEIPMQILEEKAQFKKACDAHELCSHLSFDNMARCIMSMPFEKEGESHRLMENIKVIQHYTAERILNPFLHSDFIYNFTSQAQIINEAKTDTDVVIDKIIQNRRKLLSKEQAVDSEERVAGDGAEEICIAQYKKSKGKHLDFLDILLQSKYENGDGLSETEIRDEVRLFFAAGSETTGNAMTWLTYALAQNQDWQDKCRDEVRDVCGDNPEVSWEDIGKMKTLHMCIKESLRLYPIAPYIGREVKSSLSFSDPYNESKTITLKKGTQLLLNIFALHRHPDLWEDPNKFDPERFTTENIQDRSPYAYVPFSAGPRNCIGQNFAMYEIKVSFAHILRKYRLLPVPEFPPAEMVPEVTLKPKDHVYVRIEACD